MGMTFLRENAGSDFTLYFLAYGDKPTSDKSVNGVNPVADREGILELTWNHGTEKESGKVYHDGNSEPQGFGHICISVDDLDAACKRFEEKGVEWKKRLTDGRMKVRKASFFFSLFIIRNLFALSLMFLLLHFPQANFFFFFYLVQNVAFVLDPDGYWIEVIQNEKYKAAPGKY